MRGAIRFYRAGGVLLLLLLSACAPLEGLGTGARGGLERTGLMASQSVTRAHSRVLATSSRVYVSPGGASQAVAGQELARLLLDAVRPHLPMAQAGNNSESLDEALSAASAEGADFLLYPSVVDWRDESGPLRSLRRAAREPDIIIPDLLSPPDRAVFDIHLIDVHRGIVLDSSRVATRAAWTTLGATELSALVRDGMRRYAARLGRGGPGYQ